MAGVRAADLGPGYHPWPGTADRRLGRSGAHCADTAGGGDTRQLRMAAYFIGLLLLCIPLMLQADIFAIFTITGFFHAYQLRPWQMGVVGILATSLVITASP